MQITTPATAWGVCLLPLACLLHKRFRACSCFFHTFSFLFCLQSYASLVVRDVDGSASIWPWMSRQWLFQPTATKNSSGNEFSCGSFYLKCKQHAHLTFYCMTELWPSVISLSCPNYVSVLTGKGVLFFNTTCSMVCMSVTNISPSQYAYNSIPHFLKNHFF